MMINTCNVLCVLFAFFQGTRTITFVDRSNSSHSGHQSTSGNKNTSHTGTEFVVMLMPYYNDTRIAQIIITSDGQKENFKFDIQSPYPGSFPTVYSEPNVAVVDLPLSILDLTDGTNFNAIKIKSDHSISVVGLIGLGPYATDAFMAIPIEKLGHSYFISSHTQYAKETQTIGIASILDNTQVNILFSNTTDIFLKSSNHTISAGSNFSISLGYLETFYFETDDDITGTLIESSNPVAVFNGLKQVGTTYLYSTKKYTQNIKLIGIEQLPPSTSYGQEFIIPPLLYSSTVDARVVSVKPNSKIYTYSDDAYTVYNNEHVNKLTLKKPFTVASRDPLLVTLHVKTFYQTSSATFTVNVPSLSQFGNKYVLSVPYTNTTFENFATVIIKSEDVTGLRFDNHIISPVSETEINYENQLYKTLVLRLSPIHSHSVTHISAEVVFGVIVHGVGINFAYGYPAGMHL